MAENAAKINYKYGEMAAENAFERQQVLYNRTYQDQSYANQVAQMDAAGLSPGLMYGKGGGGGGLFSKVGKFLGGIFGNAGGGQESGLRWVGEEGPELVASGPNAMRVYNMRQMAFAGGGGSQQSTKYYDHRTYNISGVETQQVVAYIENTRREDQRGMLRMLERNGFGSMR